MKKIFAVLLAAMVIFASGCQSQDTGKIDYSDSSFSLSPKPLAAKSVKQNPYLAKSESNIHNDGYNSDSTDAILPLGIYTEVNSSLETVVYKLLLPYSTMNTATLFHRFWVELP